MIVLQFFIKILFLFFYCDKTFFDLNNKKISFPVIYQDGGDKLQDFSYKLVN